MCYPDIIHSSSTTDGQQALGGDPKKLCNPIVFQERGAKGIVFSIERERNVARKAVMNEKKIDNLISWVAELVDEFILFIRLPEGERTEVRTFIYLFLFLIPSAVGNVCI